jgi:single-strand DNA-binding protein
MASLNKVFIIGNLTHDIELKHVGNDSCVTNFCIAANRKYKKGDELKKETCFVDITVWNKQAENCVKYLEKGKSILVEGRLDYRQWETSEGVKRNKLNIVADNIQFLSYNKEKESSGNKGTNENSVSDTYETDDIPF